MQRAELIRIVTVVCVVLLLITAFAWALVWGRGLLVQRFNDPQEMALNRELVLRTCKCLHLAMTIEEVDAEIARLQWPKEWCIRSYLEEYGHIILETPFELGAKNWVLHLMFEEEELVAFVVRTMDSESGHPLDAPPDVVRKGFKLPDHF